MKNQRARSATRIVCCLAAALSSAALSLLTVLAGAGLSQQSGAPMGPPPGGPDLKAEAQQREMRETLLRNAGMGAEIEKRDQKRIEAAIEQVKQDFKQIQIVRNEIVRSLMADKPLDYKLVAEKVGEINKRTERLRTYLIAPAPEVKEKSHKTQVEFNNEAMKGALIQLCNQIANFIENPVLKTPGTVDVEQSTRAGGDLLGIIDLSGNIKRSAEKLHKSPK